MTILVAVVMTILNMLYTVACVETKFRCPFLTIETLSKKDRLFCYPKNIPGRYCGGRSVDGGMYVDVKCHIQAPSRFGGEPHSYPHFKRNKNSLKAT